ncbi:MAG: hypothetical protein R3300_07315 [Candidatus Promineifilaceae bacterium]|nr:hypothetical protein [Candidatus Promineifilaceae bacterium]
MFLIRLIGTLTSLLGGALLGNWVGEQLQAYLNGKPSRQTTFVHTNEDGETVIAINAVREHLIPALLFGLSGKPRWLFAFLGGVLASGLLETVRQQVGDRPPPVGWS